MSPVRRKRPVGQPGAAPSLRDQDPRRRRQQVLELVEPLYFDAAGRVALRSSDADSALTVSSDYAVADGITKVVCSSAPGAMSVYIPPAVTMEGEELVINAGASAAANNVTVVPFGAETIDGSTSSVVLSSNYGSVRYLSTGTEWVSV